MALSLLAKAKQYFTSKSQDNEGWLRQGKFTPVKQLANIGYNVATKTVPTVLNTVKNDVYSFGEGLGKAAIAPFEANRLMDTAKLNASISQQNIQKAIQLKNQGNIEGYKRLLEFNNRPTQNTNDINRFLAQTEKDKNQTIVGGIKTAGYLPSVWGGGVGQYALGGLLGAGAARLQGQDPYIGAGKAIADVKRYNLVTQFTSPLTRSFLGEIAKGSAGPIAKGLYSRMTGGFGNVIEDEILAGLEKQNRGTLDRALSFGIGFVASGPKSSNDLRLKDLKKMMRNEWERSLTQSGYAGMPQKEKEALYKVVQAGADMYDKATPAFKKAFDFNNPYSSLAESDQEFMKKFNSGRVGQHSEADVKRAIEISQRSNYDKIIQPGQGTRKITPAEHYALSKENTPEINSLVTEAKKYKSVDEFVNTYENSFTYKGQKADKKFLTDIWNQSQSIKTGGEGINQPTIKIKPSEKIKIKPTLENQVASPQTSKLPKTQQQLETNPLNPVTKPESTLADSSSPYFNTKNLNIKDKSKTFVTKTIEEVKPEIEKVTGKKLTNKETVEFANNSAGVLNKVVTRTETLAWEAKMLKARELLAKQASEGKITQEYLDNLLAIKSQGSDIARKLQSLSMGADPKEATAKQAILEAILKVTDDTEALLKKAKGVDFNDYDQAASFYRQFVKPKASDWLEKVRYSSMLSSPNTHINNASSNFQGTGIIAPIEKTISGQVDWLLSAINPNRKRQQFAGEGAAYAKGYYSNIGNAWTKFTDTMTGKKLSSAQEMYSLPLTEKGTTGRKVENVLSVPGKLLQAADEFFQTLTEGGSTEALKYREGQGIKIRDIEGQAYLEGRKRLFNSGFGLKEEGYVLKALEFIPQKVAEARMSSNPVISTIAKYTFPFVRVPSNILKASVEYGPLGVTTLPGASNKVGQLSKAILGTSIGLAVAALVGEDRLTWAEPRDEKKRNAARAAGWQPYSLKIGNNYYSYSKMHPAIAFNLALVAAVRDSEKKKLLDDGQVETVLNGLAKWVNFYADMSYVKNIGDAVSGINGDLSAGTRQVSNYVQQLVPFRALMGWVARIVDPYQRQVDPKGEILDKQLQQLMTQIPGLSSQVPIRQDSSGNLVENPHRLINAFSPSRVTTEKTKLMGDYNRLEGLTQFNRQEAVIKQQVADTGQEQIYNGKKYYPSFETDSKTGEKKPIVKSIKVTQSMSEIYQGLDKEYQVSEDAPKNFIQKIGVYGTGIFKDPKGTLHAIKTGQPIRKVRGDAVVVERLKGLDTLDQGDQATQVDHIVAVSLGGTNDESNLQIISKQENQAKGVVDTYLANLLDKGLIKKVEAQERDLNWRNEISNLPISEKKKIETIMSKEPEPMKENVSETILTKLSSKEYEPIYNEDTKTYSNVTIKIPEYPKLTGQTELDKKLKSKYSSALTTARNNITKLYLDGQITAKEAEEALIALNNKKSSTGKSKSKGGKITIAKTPEPKVIKFKLPTIKLPTNTLKSNIKIKKPSIAQLKKRRTIKIKV